MNLGNAKNIEVFNLVFDVCFQEPIDYRLRAYLQKYFMDEIRKYTEPIFTL